MPTMTDTENSSEELIAAICDRLFFRDFVVRNPRFRKESGLEKEAADVLVLDDETLLAIQVKGKELRSPGSDVEVGRLSKAIDGGIRQLKTIQRAVAAKQLTHVLTLRGIELPLTAQVDPRLVGVVILDLTNEEAIQPELRPVILAGFDKVGEMPAHVFLRSTFEVLATELDTLPDFLHYLDTRQALMERRILLPLTEELDFLAMYKMNAPMIQDVVDGKINLLIIAEGTWAQYVADGTDQRERRRLANEPSYLVDGMIDFFHTALLEKRDGDTVPPATVEEYFSAVSELGRLNRVERRVLGEKIHEKLLAATTKGFAYGLMADPVKGTGTFFLSTSKPRAERIVALQNLTRAAAHHVGVKRIVGIATEPDGVRERTFDAVVLRDLVETPDDAATLEDMAKTLFGPKKAYSRHEWE
jgi:hypothetical protein